jgi:FtsP/CotA-like multicopper oxidase with cupredoxin domain
MNTHPIRHSKSLAVAILATMHGAALAQQPLDPKKPVQVITNKLTGTGTKEGKIDSPLYTVFGKTAIPGAAQDPGTGVPATGVNVRSYTLPDGKHESNPSLNPPQLPGPTFVFQPGDLLRLRFHNFLNRSTNPALNQFANDPQGGTGQGNPGASDDTAGHVSHEISIPNDSDITNLHVHGLHVDPKQDNVTLLILPEDTDPSGLVPELQRFVPTINRWWTRTYQYKLPADHLPGTFWYHAHKHGSTSSQVENGMAGSLLILPPDIQLPPVSQTRTIVPGLWNPDPAKSHDRILMIQQVANFGVVANLGIRQGKGPSQGKPAAKAKGGVQPPVNNINAPVTTTNGQYQPILELPATQIERWRFVVAGANHTTSSYLWVGSMTPVIPAETLTVLRGITHQSDPTGTPPTPTDPTDVTDATNYINGTFPFPKVTTMQCNALPGTVKIVAADGIDIWQPRDITPGSPGLGSAGNRLDFLVQPSADIDRSKPYGIYMNYPVDPDALVSAHPAIFGADLAGHIGTSRLAALTKGQVTGGGSTTTFSAGASGPTLPPYSLPTDPYGLGTLNQGPNAFSVWWATVDAEGKPLPVGQQPHLNNDPNKPLIQQQVVPLLTATSDGKGIKIDSTTAEGPGVKIDQLWSTQKKFPDGRWQPANAGSGLPVTNAILAKLSITDKSKATGPTTLPAQLNDVASALSPAGTGTRLNRVDPRTRLLVPGIPSYVAPIQDSDIAGYQVAVFDRGQFSFDYINKATQLTQPFRQFWITGRQFSIDDWVGNPATQSLMRRPLINLEPSLGSYNPASTETLWTHQKTLGDTESGPIFITNPGYTAKITAMAGTIGGNTYYNYDHPNAKPLTYQSVTGLAEHPHTPVSTTAEEWLLINNSDMFHPFHIHINPFFVTEIGQLNYTKGATPEWQPKKLTLTDKGNSAVPFSWIVGNWWDVITLPPHGYVRMRMWINVPSQLPANVDDRTPDNDLTVYDNANVYGSWVMHCHILRHEDRGMMSMVNTEPRSTSLAGEWTQDGGGTSTISDNHGGLRITPPPPATPPNAISPSYPGTFSRGIGNPLFSQPWLGSMSPVLPNVISFCTTETAQEMVRSDGHLWQRGTTAPAAITFATTNIDLSGNWTDDGGNIATIKQSPPNATGVAGLTFTPVSPVWWSTGTGSWAPPTAPPTGVYAGTQTVVNNAKQNQQLTFCVSGDLKTIVFGNGVKWKKQ